MRVSLGAVLTKFLSRLCGGEVMLERMIKPLTFLSRLCGGEEVSPEWLIDGIFLSRLCGGEVPPNIFLWLLYISKPPMWR